MPLKLLDAQLGISQVLAPKTEEHLPSLEGFTSISQGSSLHEVEIYKATLAMDAMSNKLAQSFAPQLSFNEQLQDHSITNALQESAIILEKVQNSEVRNFLNTDLQPLLENKQLLKAIQGMMIQG